MPDLIPDNLQLRFDPIWPWPIVLLVAAGLVVTVVRSYPRRIRHLPRLLQRSLLGLRLAAVVLLIWAMFRPSLVVSETDERAGQLVIVGDYSRSQSQEDGPAGLTRYQMVLSTLSECRDLLEEISEEVEIVYYQFSDEIEQVDQLPQQPDGQMTAIGHAVDYLGRELRSDVVTGVILFSDGAQRALPPYAVDPRAAVRQFRAVQNAPIHTVVVGTSGLSESTLDQILEDLQVNPTVFVKNEVVVGGNVRALGVANRDLTVRLFVEDLSIRGGKDNMRQQGPALKIRTTRSEDVIPVELPFTPQQPGEYKVSLRVDPVDGELVTSNNVLDTFITVLKGGLNVAYFDVWRPEFGKVKAIGLSPDIEVDAKLVYYRGRENPTTIDEEWFEPGKYDVYIIGDVPARVFGEQNLRRLRQAVEQGSGLLMTGGFHSFGAGGYATTPLNDLLPVVMYATEILNDDEVDSSLQIEEQLQMLPTAEGNASFVMRLDAPAKNLEMWQKLPKLEGATKLTPKIQGLARVLAETESKQPLLIAQEYDRGRTMAFAADTTYLWYLAGFDAQQQQFWRQVILWLAHKESQGDDSVWVKLESRRYRPGQPVPFTFGARDEKGRPLEDVEFKVQVIGPQQEKFQIPPQRDGEFNSGTFTQTAQPGEYRVEVSALQQGKPIGFSARARFVIFEQDLELYNPAADPSLMQEISSMTQGRSLRPDEFRGFLEELMGRGLNRQMTQNHVVSLWDHWILLVAFVGVMSVEWFLRKKRGLV